MRNIPYLLLFLSGFISSGAAQALSVQPQTSLQVQVERDTSMRLGRLVRASVIYPVFIDNQVAIPAGTELVGRITALSQATKRKRVQARLGGDFTPLHQAQISFDTLMPPGGSPVKVDSETVGTGAEVVRFVAPGASRHEPLFKRMWTVAAGREKGMVRTFTAPGKMERIERAFYSELPYHPEILSAGTEYTVVLKQVRIRTLVAESSKTAPGEKIDSTVKIAAVLLNAISSKNAVRGTKVSAEVVEPAFDSKHELLVPQGSLLLGEVIQAQPSGKWGRGGTLRFSFHELRFPAGFAQRVQGVPSAVDADLSANLRVDEEGGVKPAHKGIAAPLTMGLLAASAIHEDEASVLHTGGTSNGFALLGRIAALASNSTMVGASIGFYGMGRAVYSRFIAHGSDVTFPKDTRIEVTLNPGSLNRLTPTMRQP